MAWLIDCCIDWHSLATNTVTNKFHIFLNWQQKTKPKKQLEKSSWGSENVGMSSVNPNVPSGDRLINHAANRMKGKRGGIYPWENQSNDIIALVVHVFSRGPCHKLVVHSVSFNYTHTFGSLPYKKLKKKYHPNKPTAILESN